jgi:hypothetical protein
MWKSPINIMYEKMQIEIEDEIIKAVHKYGVYVDKDELLKALKYDREQYEKGYRDGSRYSEWIPCSERLPNRDGFYLATVSDYHEAIYLQFEKGDESWIDYECTPCDVIAWMPLPEPYQEGE